MEFNMIPRKCLNVLLVLSVAMFITSCTQPPQKSTAVKVPVKKKDQKIDISKIYSEGKCLVVDKAHASASDQNPGTPDKPFLTINAAAQKAKVGWTVLVREGIYRERIKPIASGDKKNPIVFQGVAKEKVIVKGSDEWKPKWTAIGAKKDVFKAVIDTSLFIDGINPYFIGISVASKDKDIVARPSEAEQLPFTLGQIFINSKPLEQVQSKSELKFGSWLVTADGKNMLLKLPQDIKKPENCLIELSVRNRIFCPRKRGLKHIHIKGFTFEHCANQGPFPQGGAVSVRSGSHWLIEDNIIRYAKMIGLDCGGETWSTKDLKDTDEQDKRLMLGGGHIIRKNVISDNGLCGIAGWNHRGTKIIGNILERNNRLKIDKPLASWEEWGAIKLHCTDALIEGNLIRDNNAFGIWIDNGYKNARIVKNLLHNNQKSGIFLELGAGRCLVANNIISATRPKGNFYKGFGVYAHDAGDITVANNLIINNPGAGVFMRTITNRKFGGKLTQTSNEEIFNNLMVNNGGGVSLPLEYSRGKNNKSNYNFFSYDKTLVTFGFPWSIGGPSGKKKIANIKAVAEKSGNSKLMADFKLWEEKKVVPIGLWQEVTGQDKNSLYKKDGVKIKLNPTDFTITVIPGSSLLKMKCPPVSKVKNDIIGQAVNGKTVIPGPFQDLKPGKNNFKLWPSLTK